MHPAQRSVDGIPVAAEAIVALAPAIDPGRGDETVRSWNTEPHVWK